MNSKLKSWPDFHHRINLVYHATIAVSLVPFALIFLDIDSGRNTMGKIDPQYDWIVIILGVAGSCVFCLLAWRNAKEQLLGIDTQLGIKEKLSLYLGFQRRRYFQLEAAALSSLAGLWLSADYSLVIVYILVLVQFSFLRPSQDKVIRDLRFTPEERERLRGEKL